MRTLTTAFILLSATSAPSAAQLCPPQLQQNTATQFSLVGDGSVADAVTQRQWKQCPEGSSGNLCATGNPSLMTWQTALQHVEALNADATAGGNNYNHLGFNDWRLPNIKELASIVHLKCIVPAINSQFFPNLNIDAVYWTSSPGPNNMVWTIDFAYGTDAPTNKAETGYLILVRQ